MSCNYNCKHTYECPHPFMCATPTRYRSGGESTQDGIPTRPLESYIEPKKGWLARLIDTFRKGVL